MAAAPPLIRLEGVEKTFNLAGMPVPVLKGIDLTVERGEFTALRGPSGSGKSTLLYILGLLDTASSGRYLLDGQDTAGLPDDDLAALRNRKIGFVFQSFYLIPYATALDNVVLPGLYGQAPARKVRARAAELLDLVGLADRKDFKPAQLSGGQQQRVAMARSLINDPDLILADELTGQLDSATSAEIMSLLTRINQTGKTIVVVTHDPETASYARRQVHVKDGKVAEEGE